MPPAQDCIFPALILAGFKWKKLIGRAWIQSCGQMVEEDLILWMEAPTVIMWLKVWDVELDSKTLLSTPPVEMFHECSMEHGTVKKTISTSQSINQSDLLWFLQFVFTKHSSTFSPDLKCNLDDPQSSYVPFSLPHPLSLQRCWNYLHFYGVLGFPKQLVFFFLKHLKKTENFLVHLLFQLRSRGIVY